MDAAPVLSLLSAGAAKGLVEALQQRLSAATGARLEARFGAVGAMKEALLGGAPCDVMLSTDAVLEELVASGEVGAAPRAALGRVRTGIAVRDGDSTPAVDTPEALRDALLAADRIYFPDAERSTAGIHFASVLRRLGLREQLAGRLATFPNGATAMREMAAGHDRRPIGCTQVTEIRYTPGVRLVGALPREFELTTLYGAAVAARAADPQRAARFIALLAGEDTRDLRRGGGFELD